MFKWLTQIQLALVPMLMMPYCTTGILAMAPLVMSPQLRTNLTLADYIMLR